MKKTIEVTEILNWANEMLARTDEYADTKFKAGIATTIESILTKTGNYKGFGFINNDDSETGTLGYYSRFYYKNSKLSNK
jgi:hypothetical protein